MDKFKILIVEDEVLIAEDLKDTLRSFGVKQIELAHSSDEAKVKLSSFKPDLILLDIRMDTEFDGLNFAAFVNSESKIPFIYVTAHSNVAMIKEILKSVPAGYITKPVKKADLFAAISLVAEKKNIERPKELLVKDGHNTVVIPFDDISFAESDGNYVTIYYSNRKLISRQNMESLLSELDSKQFMRVHRSYIVNLARITKYSKKEVEIEGMIIPISRMLRDIVEKVLTERAF
ncbi:MAG: LytR/AlgR family response regulator transcription factor [Bacteroidia bacterium]